MTSSSPTLVNERGFNLLSLDGGGIRGVCSAMIIQALFKRVAELHKAKPNTPRNGAGTPESTTARTVTEPHPADLFDLAAGTSTGGIIATMLFRLRMNPDQVVESYGEFGHQVFSPKIGPLELNFMGPLGSWVSSTLLWGKALFGGSRHATGDIEKVIDSLVSKSIYGADREKRGMSKLVYEPEAGSATPPGRMLLCATRTDESETVTFRNYIPSDKVMPEYRDITIKDALCATTAAPLYMPKTVVHVSQTATDTFWDGGLLNNNPVFQVWAARFDLIPPLEPTAKTTQIPNVKTLVSIGCGRSKTPPKVPVTATGILSSVVNYATNTWARHVDFLRDVRRENLRTISKQRTHYFRLDPAPLDAYPNDADPGKTSIDDYRQLERLKSMTQHWLDQPQVKEKLECCARYLLDLDVPSKDCRCDACSKPDLVPQIFETPGKTGNTGKISNGK